MHFQSFAHFFNAYKKALRDRNFLFTAETLAEIEVVCTQVYNFHEGFPELLGQYSLPDAFQNLWHIANNNKKEFSLLKDLVHYDIFLFELSTIPSQEEILIREHIKTFLQKGILATRLMPIDILKNRLEDLEGEKRVRVAEDGYLLELLLEVEGESGVYILYDKVGKISYIGKSTNLPARILTSMRERRAYGFQYMKVPHSDMHIIEMYMIATFKPYLNSDGRTEDAPTFVIRLGGYETSEIIEVFEMEGVPNE